MLPDVESSVEATQTLHDQPVLIAGQGDLAERVVGDPQVVDDHGRLAATRISRLSRTGCPSDVSNDPKVV